METLFGVPMDAVMITVLTLSILVLGVVALLAWPCATYRAGARRRCSSSSA